MRLLAPVLVLALLAGCGDTGPTPEQQVRTTVSDFGRATADKDYKTLCGRILAPKLIDDVTSVGLPCEAALKRGLQDVKDPRLTIGRIEIHGDRASAEIRSSASGQEPSKDTLDLVKVNGTWKISSLGNG